MAQRRFHYERAFEHYLRARRIPYVSVDEARKALLPENHSFRLYADHSAGHADPNFDPASTPPHTIALKSFDFVIYTPDGSPEPNLLIDIKGRRVGTVRKGGALSARLESWVTQDDIDSLAHWETLFGPGYQAAFVFVYWCDRQPPDALFQEVMDFRGVWYALRAVTLDAYRRAMKVRSPRWRTVHVPPDIFQRISQPFVPRPSGRSGGAGAAAGRPPKPLELGYEAEPEGALPVEHIAGTILP